MIVAGLFDKISTLSIMVLMPIVHIIAIVMAYNLKGTIASIITLILLVGSELYWLISTWDRSEMFCHYFRLGVLILSCTAIIDFLSNLVININDEKISA